MKFKSISKFLLATVAMLLISLNAYSQSVRLTGKVVDPANVPIIGAGVVVAGTTNGTVTDVDGNFSITAQRGATLNVSCIGYVDQNVVVGNQTNIVVTLAEDSELLDETVVIGYGVQRKSDVTGSIASVKAEDLQNRTSSDPLSAIQGRAAGVQINMNSGAPGKSAAIQIRGYSSNSTTSPLYIVDGLKVATLDFLDPSNIESMEILKDGASAAIYGVEAGNGVVLITTKSGASAKGKGCISYSYQNTTESIPELDLMNAREYLDYMVMAGVAMEQDFGWDGVTDTDWIDIMTEKGVMERHTVGFEGSNDKGSLFVSLTSLNNNGVILGDKDVFNRLSAQINAQYKINDWATIGVTTSLENRTARQVSEGVTSVIGSILTSAPITPYTYGPNNVPESIQALIDQGRDLPADENGNVYGVSQYGGTHPAVQLLSVNNTSGFNVRGTGYLNLSPIKGFTFTSRLGYRAGYNNSGRYTPEYWETPTVARDRSLTGTISNNLYYQWENFANYTVDIAKHNITAMAGMSFQHSQSNNLSGTVNELTSYDENFLYFDNAVNNQSMRITGSPNESANTSYFARLGWSYDRRYNVQVSFRADAYDTSKLEKNHRWGYFPSVSAGWTISNEPWMKDFARQIDLSSLKLRASWGINGNVNALSGYQYASNLTNNMASGYNFGSAEKPDYISGVSPLKPGAGWWVPSTVVLPNPEIKWETSHQVDIGLDARFFRNRLSFSMDWYNKNTEDLLTTTVPPANTGATTMYVNLGKINNTGFELEVDWKDSIGDFTYEVAANGAWLKNTVVEGFQTGRVNGATGGNVNAVTFFEEGYPLWYLGLYQYEGVNPTTGEAIYTDINDDGVLNTEDQIYSGKGIPDLTYGFTVNLAYKGFDLIVNGAGVAGVDKLFAVFRSDRFHNNRPKYYYDNAWKSPQQASAILPKPDAADSFLTASTAFMYDASFLKIKQIQIGYTVPENLVKKAGLSNLRVYASFDDFFTFTKYNGFDPETSSGGSSIALDSGAYPVTKKLVFGVNVAF